MAHRLSSFQEQLGWKTQFHFLTNSNLRARPFSLPLHTLAASVDQFAIRSKKHSAPISLVRDLLGPVNSAATGRPDIVHFHWMNGVGRLKDFREIFPSSSFFLTLHDMNPFTGVCHYSLGCDKYTSGCAGCPAVKSPLRPFVKQHLASKKREPNGVGPIHLISPSEWLKDCVGQSILSEAATVSVIRNPLRDVPENLPVANRRKDPLVRFLIVAADLDDPIKGVDEAVEACGSAPGDNWELRLIGKRTNKFSEDSRIRFLGPLESQDLEREFSDADAIIIPSLEDNAPLVFGEATAHGIFPIVRKTSGLPELVTAMGHGALFKEPDELRAELGRFVAVSASVKNRMRLEIAGRAQKEFGPLVIAQRHLDLYTSVLANDSTASPE